MYNSATKRQIKIIIIIIINIFNHFITIPLLIIYHYSINSDTIILIPFGARVVCHSQSVARDASNSC